MSGEVTRAVSEVRLVIYGEPASKANSRRIVPRGEKFASIKSQRAMDWLVLAGRQVPRRSTVPFPKGELVAFFRIHYRTQRPDLDESLVLDFLQGRVYGNDRQVRERHIYHHIDADNPRVELVIRPRGAA